MLQHGDEERNMAPDERSRVEASQALSEQLGPAAAAALMECIPPYGWHEIATKSDLAALEQRIGLRFEAFEARLDAKLEAQATRMIKWTVGSIFAGIAAIGAAVAGIAALVS
jgi:hypothetical protein